ncbi:hypothetical protein FHS85_004972 [Rhodoligotrophos appendicifer]|uniref:hypothetical protein n=1 Tax=Rhodoligotrophos appendicifer TaxID=987056 RepID=UPI001185DB35|nr:hypothetical protein [Rhodoligotrophos appendicifer]
MISNLIDIAVQVRHTTERAALVHEGAREAWIPLPKAELISNGDGTHTLTCPEWLAKDKGLM